MYKETCNVIRDDKGNSISFVPKFFGNSFPIVLQVNTGNWTSRTSDGQIQGASADEAVLEVSPTVALHKF